MTQEEQLIGDLLMSPENMEKVADYLEPQMFTNAICGLIYSELLKGRNIYAIQQKYVDRPEVTMQMTECVDGFITSVGVEDVARQVYDRYRAEKLNGALNKIKPTGATIEEMLGQLQTTLDELQGSAEIECRSLGELAKEYKSYYFKDHETIKLGFKGIDECLVSLERGDITVIGARPAVGKSALSAQLGLNLSAQGLNVGFFVLEMNSKQIYERYAAMKSGIQMQRIRRATTFHNDEEEKFTKANEELEKCELKIITKCHSVEQIRKTVKAFKFDVIIVDYMQLVKAKTTYGGNRVNEVSEISADFKRLAMEMGCHVILLSQLNRNSEMKKRPSMADLRETGAIEQDASNVLLIWNLKTKGEKGLSIEKCRQGNLGGFVLQFDGDHMTFTETNKSLKEEEKWGTTTVNPFTKTTN